LPVELRVADVGRRMAGRVLAAVEDAGISEGAWWVLYELASTPGGLPLTQLARRTGFSASTMTAVTDHLAALGWTSRERAAAVVTEAGLSALDAGLDAAERAFAADRARRSGRTWIARCLCCPPTWSSSPYLRIRPGPGDRRAEEPRRSSRAQAVGAAGQETPEPA
jgi:DNA-binding MarR family transcriptional regulator